MLHTRTVKTTTGAGYSRRFAPHLLGGPRCAKSLNSSSPLRRPSFCGTSSNSRTRASTLHSRSAIDRSFLAFTSWEGRSNSASRSSSAFSRHAAQTRSRNWDSRNENRSLQLKSRNCARDLSYASRAQTRSCHSSTRNQSRRTWNAGRSESRSTCCASRRRSRSSW